MGRTVGSARTLASTRTTTTARTTATNLVYNGDFEIAPAFTAATNTVNRDINGTAAGINTPRSAWGWYTNTVTGTVGAQFDTAQFHSGTTSMKLSTLATASRIAISNSQFTTGLASRYGWVLVAPNTTYNFQMWAKTTANSGAATSGLQANLVELNSDGTTQAASTSVFTGVNTTTDWTLYTKQITTTATSNYVRILIDLVGNNGTGTLVMDAWVDGIQMVPATLPGRTTVS